MKQSALSVSPLLAKQCLCQGIEGLLQENLRMGPQQGLNLGWGDDLEASRYYLDDGLGIPSCTNLACADIVL